MRATMRATRRSTSPSARVAGNRDAIRDENKTPEAGRDFSRQDTWRMLDVGNVLLDLRAEESFRSNRQGEHAVEARAHNEHAIAL
jgi:hypothetical protein